MMETRADCRFDESAAARYVAGRMTEDEAEAFEAHYFGCDRCFAEVRTAQELQSALEPARGPRAVRRRLWLPLAAAAALLVAVGAWMLARQPGDGRVFRSGRGAELVLAVSASGSEVTVSWTPVPEARVYSARVVTADGTLVTAQELGAPPLLLARQGRPATTLYVTVQALGPDRQVLVSSAPLELPTGSNPSR